MSDAKVKFHGEVMFAGWSDSHKSGPRVCFWLEDSDALEVFRGMTERKGKTAGQLLYLTLTAVDESEEQSTQPTQKRAVSPVQVPPDMQSKHGTHLGPLCMSAAMLCREPDFQEFCWVTDEDPRKPTIVREKSREEYAAGVVRARCGVGSRRDLDTDPIAAREFSSMMQEYREWMSDCQQTT